MSKFDKFKTNSNFVGGRHHSGTNSIRGVVSVKGTKILVQLQVKTLKQL